MLDRLRRENPRGRPAQSDVWLPLDGGAREIIVQIGEVFEDACLAVVGDDFESFLRGWGDYYTQLSSRDLDDDDFYEILGRANPGLPDPRPDPYERGASPSGAG